MSTNEQLQLEYRLYPVKNRKPEAGTKVDVWREGHKGMEVATVRIETSNRVFWDIFKDGRMKSFEAYPSDFWRPNRTEFFAQLQPKAGQTVSTT